MNPRRSILRILSLPAAQNATDLRLSNGDICQKNVLQDDVIPAKAGIHVASLWICAGGALDSRLRGNDGGFEVASYSK